MSKNSKDIVFVAAQRSAIGRYKGIYKDLQAHNLGSLVIKSLEAKDESSILLAALICGPTIKPRSWEDGAELSLELSISFDMPL